MGGYIRDLKIFCENAERRVRSLDTEQVYATVIFYPNALAPGSLQIISQFTTAVVNGDFALTHPTTGKPLQLDHVNGGISKQATPATPLDNGDGSPSSGTSPLVIGSAVGATLFITVAGLLLWNMKHKTQKQVGPEESSRGGGEDRAGSFPFPPKDMFELDRRRLVAGKKLGNGAFGVVRLGTYTNPKGGVINVAVKQCGEDATHQMKTTFLEEARVMKPFVRTPHANIIQMIGTCFQAEPLLLVVELMHTDLLDALRANAPPEAPGFSVPLRVRICVDVAAALAFLAKMRFVHRDLACRNILVDETLDNVKVADFGLSKDVVMEEYYTLATKTILPVRWMAPESLTRGTFSAHTDVWSLGVLFYEVFTHGERPYASIGNADILDYIKDGKRLRKPMDCPVRVFSQMKYCWEATPSERPDAIDVHASLLDFYATEYVEKGLAQARPQPPPAYSRAGRGSTSSSTEECFNSDVREQKHQLSGMAAPSSTHAKNLTMKNTAPNTADLPKVRETRPSNQRHGPSSLPQAKSGAPALMSVQAAHDQHKLAESDATHDAAYMAVSPEGMAAARGESMTGDSLYTPLEPAEKQPAIREPTFVLDGTKVRKDSTTLTFSAGGAVGTGKFEMPPAQYVPVDRASIAEGPPAGEKELKSSRDATALEVIEI